LPLFAILPDAEHPLLVELLKNHIRHAYIFYARSLEGLGQYDTAFAEYQILAEYYMGYEAKCRYALLLKKLGHTEKSQQLFKDIVNQAKSLSRGYQQAQKQWIDIAKQNL